MNRYDKWVRNIGIGIFILMLVLSAILGSDQARSDPDRNNGPHDVFEGMPLQRATIADGGSLNRGETFTLTIPGKAGEYIKNVTAMISWTDESNPPRPTVRRYENQPDTFSVRIMSPYGNTSDNQASNSIGSAGTVETVISLDDLFLNQLYGENKLGMGNWTVEVTLTSTGAWTPMRGLGLLDLPDNSNAFSLSVDYEYYLEELQDEG
ncbi:MAG: hypothetical protein ACMUHU_04210 [Thermoplasmatota archaeon]